MSRVRCVGCEARSLTFEGNKYKLAVAKKIATGAAIVGGISGSVYACKSGKAKTFINKIANSNAFKSITKFIKNIAVKVADFFKSIPEKLSNLGSKIRSILPNKPPEEGRIKY